MMGDVACCWKLVRFPNGTQSSHVSGPGSEEKVSGVMTVSYEFD